MCARIGPPTASQEHVKVVKMQRQRGADAACVSAVEGGRGEVRH